MMDEALQARWDRLRERSDAFLGVILRRIWAVLLARRDKGGWPTRENPTAEEGEC